MMDASTAPREVSAVEAMKTALKPLSVPDNFVAPEPKKSKLTMGGLSILPGLSARPSKPLILYEFEANVDCKRVREACSLLDLSVECRPCPAAAYGYSDQMATVTLGKRAVPFMIDNNPKMYR